MNYLFDTGSLQHLLPLHDRISEPDQEHCATGPEIRRLVVSRDLGLETTSVTDTLDDPGDEGRTVEHAHFPRHADIRVDQRVVVGNHVLVRSVRRDGVFEGVCGTTEQEAPERSMDQVEQGDDAEGTVRG